MSKLEKYSFYCTKCCNNLNLPEWFISSSRIFALFCDLWYQYHQLNVDHSITTNERIFVVRILYEGWTNTVNKLYYIVISSNLYSFHQVETVGINYGYNVQYNDIIPWTFKSFFIVLPTFFITTTDIWQTG